MSGREIVATKRLVEVGNIELALEEKSDDKVEALVVKAEEDAGEKTVEKEAARRQQRRKQHKQAVEEEAPQQPETESSEESTQQTSFTCEQAIEYAEPYVLSTWEIDSTDGLEFTYDAYSWEDSGMRYYYVSVFDEAQMKETGGGTLGHFSVYPDGTVVDGQVLDQQEERYRYTKKSDMSRKSLIIKQ